MASTMAIKINDIKCDQLPAKSLKRAGSFFVKIFVDGEEKYRTGRVEGRASAAWPDTCFLEVSSSSNLETRMYMYHTARDDEDIGSSTTSIGDIVTERVPRPTSVSCFLRKTGPGKITPVTRIRIEFRATALPSGSDTDRLQREEALIRARESFRGIKTAPSMVGKMKKLIGFSGSATEDINSFVDTWGSLLGKLEFIVKITDQLADVRYYLRRIFAGAEPPGKQIHPYAKTACFILSAVPKAIIAQRERDKSLSALLETLDDVHSFVLEAEPLQAILSHRKIIANMSRLTVECAYLIRNYTVDKNFCMWRDVLDRSPSESTNHLPGTRIVTLTFSSVDNKIKQYNDQFRELQASFQGRAIVQIDIAVFRCLTKLDDIATDISLLDMLYAEGATYDPAKCCIPGTRTAILDELHHWINLPDGDTIPRLMVLTGVAGCGKSAISHTIAAYYARLKRLGSSVFFDRADQGRRHPGNLLSTVARDVANIDAQWRSELYNIIKSNDGLRKTHSPARQMESFILEPAKVLGFCGPIVIVIDALDESGDATSRRALLKCLAQNVSALPSNFRILITTRAEDDIWRAFDSKQHIQLKTMGSLDHATIDIDIAAFIESQLADLVAILEKAMPEKQWCHGLVGASDHLFQWAATACRAIMRRRGGHNPTEILVNLISNKRNLDELYMDILAREFDKKDGVAMSRFRRVMGNVLGVKEPLTKRIHCELWRRGNNDDVFESVIGPLGSLLSGTNDSNTPIGALHTSFFDFLRNAGRSGAYFVDPVQQSEALTLMCFRVMNSTLKFNICSLESSHKLNTAVPDLAARLQTPLEPVVSYSCRSIGTHLKDTEHNGGIHKQLEEFLQDHFLHWLEVLSLEKRMNTASVSLGAILTWTQKHSPELTAFVNDAISFVRVFAPPISESAPHIYLSALPFAPKHSLVYQRYSRQYAGTVRLSLGSLNSWPSALKTIEVHKRNVTSVAYSPDGKHIVSGSWDKTIRISDAETGEIVIGPFIGHTNWVMSVDFSLDGKYVASGSFDGTVRIWDVLTGEIVAGPFEDHTARVNSVAWSSDGKHVVSGSGDRTCRVWNIETGKTIAGPFEGHIASVNCVAYSPDGKQIVSGSDDQTVRVWDVQTGQILVSPFEGHTGGVNAVAYSPDGQLIASGSSDKTVRVWNIATRELVAGPFEGHDDSVTSIAYSPDGKFIVSGSEDKTVRIFAIETGGTVAGPFEGHSGAVRSVAYSPDDRCIVSGAADSTIRVWDAGAIDSIARRTKQEHSGSVNAVAYSPDGKSIVSGSDDMTICVWDRVTGALMAGPFIGHSATVTSIAYSQDPGLSPLIPIYHPDTKWPKKGQISSRHQKAIWPLNPDRRPDMELPQVHEPCPYPDITNATSGPAEIVVAAGGGSWWRRLRENLDLEPIFVKIEY
ncbi:hypothetical protein HWV62_24942 [Athelia sp. TMB]|nr:hypothetical protein HWV62_24942 [Athelia sp. TMB]